jgi:hypothetical protein
MLVRASLEPEDGGKGERSVVGRRLGDLGKVHRDELRGRPARNKLGLIEALDQERAVGGDAERDRIFECLDQLAAGRLARGAMGDDLGQQRIVVGADRLALAQAVIDADTGAGWRAPGDECPPTAAETADAALPHRGVPRWRAR